MQPRTLYTSLLMLAIVGSALGHGEEFKEKPLKRHMRELSNIRASMAKGLRRFGVAAYNHFIKFDNWPVGNNLLSDLYPDQELFEGLLPVWQLPQLCGFIAGYVKMMPAENLPDMHVKYLKLKQSVKNQFGVIL